jgi:type I restriction-modification system DNA methylase subunit
MGLFQHSVLNKYLKEANQDVMQAAWKKLVAYFQNPVIQQNIRESKEEQFQEGFLTELFVKVFGYTINPNPDYNLTTEFKNERGAKKADGAILKDSAAIGVIELKSTTTKDLESIRLQAFDYKANQSKCVYVITSNFEKVRFYIHNAVEFEEFDLFRLNYEHFQLMWLCLAKDNLLRGIPLQMKEASILKEENVTKQIYVDYSLFKHDLYNDLVANNLNLEIFNGKPEKEIKLLLFKKSQKLLDRFLFILFSEDRGLLPPNSISEIIKQWESQSDWGDKVKLYDRYKKYFHLLNTGWKGKKHEIFAYNGGLFAPDEILDNIEISDETLKKHTEVLTAYDFETEVDVNILGHIFENSLNEIEEVTAELEGEEIDRKKSKRKKDGVFYTPKYITKYIVENTVGKLCEEKKTELAIDESEYLKSRKGRTTKKLKELDGKLDEYRNWLLSLTICDPACGSGAFLNQALDFLIREHRYIDELRAKLLDVPMVFTEVENNILENNIYGVDINDESVEIAKLSLWLRTAQKGRKLTTLSNNIKCGNSLIDVPEIAGEKAFNWQTEFPEVLKNGGFDVVIGNPPYVQLQKMGEMSEKLKSCGFETFDSGADLYCLFTERGFHLLKKGGLQSFIMPNKWLLVAYGKPLRKFMAKTGLRQVLNFGDIQFFPEATTYVCIFVTQKSNPGETAKVLSLNKKTYHGDFLTEVKANLYDYPAGRFGEKEWSIQPYSDFRKLETMKQTGIKLKELPISIYRGILTGFNQAFFIDEETREKLISEDFKSEELIKPMARGRDISAYGITGFEYLIGTFPSLNLNIENYPAIKKHLFSFGFDRLKQTGEKGSRKKTTGKWFETQDSIKYFEEFSKPKVLYPNMTSTFPFVYDENGFFSNDKSFILTAQDDSVSLPFLTAVFNSSLTKLWIWYNCPELQGGTREIRKVYFEHFPVPQASEEQTGELAHLAIKRTQLTENLREVTSRFIRSVQRKFNLEKLPGKLEKWYLLSYAEFIKELGKKKVSLSLAEEAEWEDYFNEQKQKARCLKSEIDKTDREIDRIVYELYGLTKEEIGVVEGNIN